MKILHILSGFYPTRGGVETLVTSLSDELLNLHKIHSVFVAPRYFKSRPDELFYKSHRVYSIDMLVYRGNKGSVELKGAKAAMKSLNDLRKISEIEKPDLVHIHGVFELFSSASLIAKDLTELQQEFPMVFMGSYPFEGGTSLVFRSKDQNLLDMAKNKMLGLIEKLTPTQ